MAKKSLLQRIFGLGRQKIERELDKYEDKIAILRDEIREYKNSKERIKESLVEIKGLKNKTLDDIERTKGLITDLTKAVSKAAKEGNDELGKRAYKMIKNNELKLQGLEKTVKSYDEAANKIEEQLKVIESKIIKMEDKVSELAIKDKFSKNVNSINSTINNVNSVISNLESNNELVDSIETDYFIADAKLESIKEDNDIESFLLDGNDEDYEKFKEKLLNEEK